jgi:hypothetical protein
MKLSAEKQIILYECLVETAQMLGFDVIEKAFYCGTSRKWGIPNTLIIVVPEDTENMFFPEMSCESGSHGQAYLTTRKRGINPWGPENKPNTFRYKVITDRVYEHIKNDWTRLVDDRWQHINSIVPGIELDIDLLFRHNKLKAFL